MHMTLIKSKELYKAGYVLPAWRVALQDEGLIAGTTFDKWNAWMQAKIKNEEAAA